MANFKDTSYLVRIFDFIRFFEVPHTISEACDRFDINRRTFSHYCEKLACCGVNIEKIGMDGYFNIYKADVTLGF